jgi:hypothetical protein
MRAHIQQCGQHEYPALVQGGGGGGGVVCALPQQYSAVKSVKYEDGYVVVQGFCAVASANNVR